MDADGRQYPFKGCELRSREVIRALGQVPANWRLPTFATGYMRRAPLSCKQHAPNRRRQAAVRTAMCATCCVCGLRGVKPMQSAVDRLTLVLNMLRAVLDSTHLPSQLWCQSSRWARSP